MHGMMILLLAASTVATETARSDQVTQTDGRRVPATLSLTEAGRLQFAAADRSPIPADRVQYLRFAPARPASFPPASSTRFGCRMGNG